MIRHLNKLEISLINLTDLINLNVVLEDDTYYIVEYTASDVYYTKGYDDENGETHYKVEKEEK